MKRLASLVIVTITLVMAIGGTTLGITFSQTSGNTEYQVIVDSAAHTAFGLYYPATYMFHVPTGPSSLVAQYRYNAGDRWNTLTAKASTDFFNGVNAARFDYTASTAYLSVAFAQNSDSNLLAHR